ncbi:MAG: nicotinate-nicotinamide nucleotide adenylyltransferase [Roseiflexus castenholzii]|uniref:nicotinate-nucleotide adenylyltransferase n=1 Tax=Roseiflexus castenholzii TaxID=120962 RepID=UPI000CC05298|nr:MAG: nicotinate-nicotinamide nucleotide adenylyltransferase [Roseiflexus castenholzii]
MTSGRTGILGGSFDPIHYGHLAIAEEVRVLLRLNRVLIIPAREQPLKPGGSVASPAHRLAMARLACADNPFFEVSRIEIDRPGPSYTSVTLQLLHEQGLNDLYLILGIDSVVDLPRWREVRRILDLAHIVGVARPGAAVDLSHLSQVLPELPARLIGIDGPRLDISSTDLRQRVAQGRPIRYQTPDAVVAYIEANGLYR